MRTKFLTLFVLLSCIVSNVKAQTASEQYLDLNSYATIDLENTYFFDEASSWLTVSPQRLRNGKSTNKWVSDNARGSANKTWNATDVFKGYSAYGFGSKDNCAVTLIKDKSLGLAVSSCEQISAYVLSGGSSKTKITIQMDIYELNSDGTKKSETPVATKSTQSTSNATLTATGLDGSKIYQAVFTSTHASSNSYVFEVAFKKADTRTVTSLAFEKASYDATLGSTFEAPTATSTPDGLTGITYSSSSVDVATVDKTTGAVTLKAGGKTTITASFAGDETYISSSASYVLNVSDPAAKDVTVTWTMADGADSKGVATEDKTVMKTAWETGSNIAVHSTATATYGGTKVTQFQPKDATGDTEKNAANSIEWSLTPWKGLVFTPTAVSFEAFKVGTDGPTIDAFFVDGEGNETKLEAGAKITRNNQVGVSGQPDQEHSFTLATAAASSKAVKLRIYVRACAANKQVAFGNVVISGTVSGTPAALTEYIVTTSLNLDGAGTIAPAIGENKVYETNDLKLTAQANKGYRFVDWTIDGAKQTANPYTIANINEDHTAVANFKKLQAIAFASGEGEGAVPATEYADQGETYTVPQSHFLKKDGATLTGWTDGSNTYKAGETLTVGDADITLTAVFTDNTQSLDDATEDVVVLWDFQQANIGGFNLASGYLVAQATVNGETIDVPLSFDKTIFNTNWADWAHVGSKPTLTIPAKSGIKIKLLTYEKVTATTIAGAADYTVEGSNNPYTVTYTYTGSAATVDIYLDDASYIRTLSVEYPASFVAAKIGSEGYATFASAAALDLSKLPEGLTAYKAASMAAGKVTFTPVTEAVAAGTGLLLKGTAGTSYNIPVAETGTDISGTNQLVGVTAETALEEGKAYVLKGDKFIRAAAGKLAAGKAYLPVSSGAPELTISFGAETTGISVAKAESVQGAEVYNLAGQRVSQPTKGLYIVGGKKVVMK